MWIQFDWYNVNLRGLMALFSNDYPKHLYAIAIASIYNDWLKNVASLFFSKWEAKSKAIAPCTGYFFRVLSKLQVLSRNSDWFIALFSPVVIGRSSFFELIGFTIVTWKPLHHKCSVSRRVFKVCDLKESQLAWSCIFCSSLAWLGYGGIWKEIIQGLVVIDCGRP